MEKELQIVFDATRIRRFPNRNFRRKETTLKFLLLVIMFLSRPAVSFLVRRRPTSLGRGGRGALSFVSRQQQALSLRQFLLTTARMTVSSGTGNQTVQKDDTAAIQEDFESQNTILSIDDSLSEHAAHLLTNWKEHPLLNPTIVFPSLVVRNPSQINTIISARDMQRHLSHSYELLDNMRIRFKTVRDDNEYGKVILLHPDSKFDELPTTTQESCFPGPPQSIQFTYDQFNSAYSLQQLLPDHLQPPPTAFESIGHVAHLNLRQHHYPYRYLIGQVLLESVPTIDTVLIKLGEVSGPHRTYDFEIVAGKNTTYVQMMEANLHLEFDLSNVYWCSRLSEERQRMIQLFDTQSYIADVFCGVGALCFLAARDKQCTVLANDWNEHAIECFQKNQRKNKISPEQIRVNCGDAYEFLMELGLTDQNKLPDHVVMNYPLEAPKFLGALRWWPSNGSVIPRVHVYTFARPTDTLSTEDVAVALIASNLIVDGSTMGELTDRRDELNTYFDCDVQTHAVRDVAPGKAVVCVSFSATPQLIKAMQGNFA